MRGVGDASVVGGETVSVCGINGSGGLSGEKALGEHCSEIDLRQQNLFGICAMEFSQLLPPLLLVGFNLSWLIER